MDESNERPGVVIGEQASMILGEDIRSGAVVIGNPLGEVQTLVVLRADTVEIV